MERPAALMRDTVRYVRALGNAWSFPYLIKTYFAPWKSIHDAYPRRGLQFGRMMETLTLNVTARLIGACVRTIALIVGMCTLLLVLFCFACYLILWLLLPLLLIGGGLFLFHS